MPEVFENSSCVPSNSNKWHLLSQFITSFSHYLDTVLLKDLKEHRITCWN